ncbi:hypothetical protein PGTUg99_032407 [Puccinia graminis f. sp. tritici]|uniref:RING-type domain-containing protein n=1 Tax=Puccinia graminis f. sp. tritici TaxID=56615 RepID=A0A5B0SP95_PUCGR|nr:hypothetical protein PGTUg99_032407 [Puccinia graminis f. sp. tritici]
MSDNQQTTSSRWFCHACEAYFRQPVDPQDPQCLNCHSSFVEELSSSSINSDPQTNHWSHSHHHFIDSFQDDDSPPIPSTRQRYEQQQNTRHQQQQQQQQTNRQPLHQAPFINLIDPLINILSAPSIPDPADHDQPPSSSRPTPPHRSGPNPFSSIGDFLAQHYSPQTFGSPNHFSNRSAQADVDTSNNNTATSNNQHSPNPSTSPRQAAQEPARPSAGERAPTQDGFTFGTTANPAQQPLNGLLSLLQSAFGLTPSDSAAPENERRTAESNHAGDSPAAERATSNSQPPSPSSSSSPPSSGSPETRAGNADEDRPGDAGHRTHPRPTPRSPRVNLEESHPLRQFINILNSLNQTDSSMGRNGGMNGFVFNGPTGGFGFTTQLDMDHNGPFGQNLGDYVASDSAMQDILNQLINMTGANGGHNPIPASDSTIKSLRKFKFDASCVGQEDSIECAICKDTFTVGDSCMELPCKHFFHDEDCIVLWLKQNGSCPVCRYSLVNTNDSSEDNAEEGGGAEGERGGGGGDRNAPQSSTAADDSQYRPDPADWLDPDRWYDEEHYEPPFDYD